jgi:hypothetical protein
MCSILSAGPQMGVGVQRPGRSGMAQGAPRAVDDIASDGEVSDKHRLDPLLDTRSPNALE